MHGIWAGPGRLARAPERAALLPPLRHRRQDRLGARRSEQRVDRRASAYGASWGARGRCRAGWSRALAGEIVELGADQQRAGAGEKGVRGGGERVRGRRGEVGRRRRSARARSAPRPAHASRSGARRCCARRLRAEMRPSSSRSAMSAPLHQPAKVGRSWVETQATARRGVFGGRQKIGAAPLEPQNARAEDVGAPELLAEALGHGAEILADDHALGALALERDVPEQIVDGIGEIGALGRACAPSGMTNSRARPIAWSMRSTPAWRMLAAISAEKPRKPSRAEPADWAAAHSSSGRCAENGSGGAPTLAPSASSARARPGSRRRRAPRRPRDRDRSRCRGRSPCALRRRGGELPVGEPLGEQDEGDGVALLARDLIERGAVAIAQGRRASVANPRPARRAAIASKMAKRRSASPPAATKRRNRRRSDRPAAPRERARKRRSAPSSARRLIAQTAG